MSVTMNSVLSKDHCRIGSLETYFVIFVIFVIDHCRIGSLEKGQSVTTYDYDDHCRIGSLEIKGM